MPTQRPAAGCALALAGALIAFAGRAENPAEVLELPQVAVVGTTPLPGSGVALRDMPANAQIFTSRDLRRQGAATAMDFLEKNAIGIGLAAAQGNPFQPDIALRGFAASPVLGTPQGISVFFDGVRVNEPFGDSVNWDLIPQSAISSIQIIPGSNPAFGLNTLGGAIAIYTKSGASEYPERPGASASIGAGSFGRRSLSVDGGGKSGPWDWFATATRTLDAGWALHNPSRVGQLFAKLGWQNEKTDIDLAFSAANNRLEGTQTLPESFDDPRQPYTFPDRNDNRAALVSLKGSHAITEQWLLSGNAYLRRFRNQNLSSNVVDTGGDPNAAPASNDRSSIEQTSHGAGVQLARDARVAGFANRLALGLAVDAGQARFRRSRQDAAFGADRGTVALGVPVAETDADSTTRYLGAFASDSFHLDERWTLTLAGRFNRADVRIGDRSGSEPRLTGAHRFTRFNPALGLNFNPTAALTAYATYNEGMRAPTAIELTCADPAAPCKLPNNFLADPALRKIVSKTLEVGGRGRIGNDTAWSAAIFRTDLHDDLQFVASNGLAVNAGYFQNVGTTRRQGIESALSTQSGALALALRHTWTDATFRSGFVQLSPNNSSADANGAIAVRPGNRIPGIARQTLKLRADLDANARWTIGASAVFVAATHARGDENGEDANRRVPGYARLDLDTRFRASERFTFFARIDNVLDRRYASFGILGENVFTGPSHSFDPAMPRSELFLGRGAPRSALLGVQLAFE